MAVPCAAHGNRDRQGADRIEPRLRFKRRLQMNLHRRERFRQWAARFRTGRGSLERGRIDARNLTYGFQFNLRDSKTACNRIDVHRGGGMDALGRMTLLRQHAGKRHRKAGRMRRTQQLFRIRLAAAFEPRLEAIRTVQRARLHFHVAVALFNRTIPLRFCVTNHDELSLSPVYWFRLRSWDMAKPTFDPGLTQQYTGILRRAINKDGSFNVSRRGTSWRDIHPYLHLISLPWPSFLALVFAAYLAVNTDRKST